MLVIQIKGFQRNTIGIVWVVPTVLQVIQIVNKLPVLVFGFLSFTFRATVSSPQFILALSSLFSIAFALRLAIVSLLALVQRRKIFG
jgi:hypothetical protein